MNNKGFTLAELLAIVVVLGIIVVMAAPAISKEIKKGDEEAINITNEKIENAAHLFIGKYYSNVVVGECNVNCNIEISLNELERDGLVELNDACAGIKDNTIKVYYSGNEIIYDYDDVKADDCYVEKTN